MASLIFNPVLAEVLNEPQNPLLVPNDSNSGQFSAFASSIKSALFSTNKQGNFPPSKNVATSSTEPFHLKVL
jgi:hypothetical protein